MFTLKNAKRVLFSEALQDEITRERGNEIARSMNLPIRERPLPVWRQEPSESTDVSLNLPTPGQAGKYSVLIATGLAFARVFESFFDVGFMAAKTAIVVAGKLCLWAGGLFLLTLAFHLWGWL